MTDIMQWCESIITGTGGLHSYEEHELAVPTCNRDVAIAAWVVRCLANGKSADAGEVVDAIIAQREKSKS